MSKLCIMVAPNGARRTKADHPELPILPEELAATARSCFSAGAGAIHLHVRDSQLSHSLDADTYRRAIAAVSQACPEIAIQITTEAAGIFDLDVQIAAVRMLRPSCVSFSLGELMRDGQAKGEEFLAWASGQKIAIQFILYDAMQIAEFARLWRAGALHLGDVPRIIVVAGRYSKTQDSELADFETLYDAMVANGLHESTIWMTCAFGRGEMACLERTIELGGHARVGFENAIVDADGKPARDNAERVAMVAALAAKHGRSVASSQESADILGRRGPSALL